MLRLAFLLGVVSLLPECGRDETLTGYGASDTTWALTELHGAPFGASATLRFPEEGRIEGQAPCNTFTGQQSQPYPWFRAEQVASTRRACPDLHDEAAFFQALAAMTLAEVGTTTLILSNTEGGEMVFTREP